MVLSLGWDLLGSYNTFSNHGPHGWTHSIPSWSGSLFHPRGVLIIAKKKKRVVGRRNIKNKKRIERESKEKALGKVVHGRF